VAIGVAVAGDQVSAKLAVGLQPRWIIAFRQMPGHRLLAARRVELLPSVDDGPPA
jgi:hypothetical protein